MRRQKEGIFQVKHCRKFFDLKSNSFRGKRVTFMFIIFAGALPTMVVCSKESYRINVSVVRSKLC